MAYLKNDYKLMYEHRDLTVNPADINLRATKTRPATTDTNLVYKKADGTTVDPASFKFIKEVNGNFYGSVSGKPSEATVKFSVYSGNDCIYGDEVVPPVTTYQISAVGDEEKMIAGNFDICWNFEGDDPVTTIIRKEAVPAGTKVKVYVEPNVALWDTVPTTCKVNNVDTALTKYGETDFYFIEVTVNEDVAVVFNTGTTRQPPVTTTRTRTKSTTK